MHKLKAGRQIFLIWLVAGMLLSSLVAVALTARANAQGTIAINGAGATFPFPLIDTWRVEYQKVKADVNINYQSVGSGAGVKQFTAKTIDFGGTDAPLNAAERSNLTAPAVHIPETIGSVVLAYNLPEVPNKGLKITGSVIADIFLGKIKKWDDQKIKDLNPGVALPSQAITVVHRSDGSGTTFVWTSYLSLVNTDWNSTVGKGKSVAWPTGVGGQGNDGVANTVKSTFYSVGYVELAYALTTKMSYASIQNKEGNFVEPTIDSTQAAVAAASGNLPKGDESWASVSLLNAPGANSYPVASFTYLLIYKDLSTNINSQEKAKALVDFVSWAITDGQKFAPSLQYVPLPNSVVTSDKETLVSLVYKGTPLSSGGTGGATETKISATLDNKSYEIISKSATSKPTAATIDPSSKSVKITFDKAGGDVEIKLPKTMISGVKSVIAGGQELLKDTPTETADSTTIKFTLPAGSTSTSVEILGTNVVPEFSVIAVLVLGVSIAAIIGYTRLSRNRGMGFTSGT